MTKELQQTILCAAIHYMDGKVYEDQPDNIDIGIVITGRRHHNAMQTLFQLMPDHNKSLITREAQGFLTSDNLYVTRHQAWKIAKAAGQIVYGYDAAMTESILISENLY